MSEQNNDPIKDIMATFRRIAMLQNTVRTTRMNYSTGLGLSYGGDRDLYEALGYKEVLTYQDYENIYSRGGISKRVNNAPCDAVWRVPPRVFDVGTKELTDFEKDWKEIVDNLGIWNKFNRLDKLLGFGRYSVLLLGFDDVKNVADMGQPIKQGSKLLYIQCFKEHNATIKQLDADIKSIRYGYPKYYTINLASATSDVEDGTVAPVSMEKGDLLLASEVATHHSRVVHVLEDNLEGDIYGDPRLRNPYNRLQDIDKVVGGSAEMFWRGARPGYSAQMDPEYQWDEDDPNIADMREQLEEYENNLRRFLFMQGVDIKSLETQVQDPLKHLDAQLQDLSAGTRIPKRILTGSERGELASSQDRSNWLDYIDERRNWFATPIVIRPFIDRLIEVGTISKPENDKYQVQWPNLRSVSEKDRAQAGILRSNSMARYLSTPDSVKVMPLEMFIRLCLGLDEDQIIELLSKVNLEEDFETGERTTPSVISRNPDDSEEAAMTDDTGGINEQRGE